MIIILPKLYFFVKERFSANFYHVAKRYRQRGEFGLLGGRVHSGPTKLNKDFLSTLERAEFEANDLGGQNLSLCRAIPTLRRSRRSRRGHVTRAIGKVVTPAGGSRGS